MGESFSEEEAPKTGKRKRSEPEQTGSRQKKQRSGSKETDDCNAMSVDGDGNDGTDAHPTSQVHKSHIISSGDLDNDSNEVNGKAAVAAVEDREKDEQGKLSSSQSPMSQEVDGGDDESSALSSAEELDPPSPPPKRSYKPAAKRKVKSDDYDSDLSSLTDKAPKPKRRSQKTKSTAQEDTSKTAAKSSRPPKRSSSSSTQSNTTSSSSKTRTSEIKELQSQLHQCGVRRIWRRELKDCHTPDDKIAHLRGMLRDIGLEGQFSESKARTIRDRLELEADLLATREFEARYGSGRGRPGRQTMAAASAAHFALVNGAGAHDGAEDERERPEESREEKVECRAVRDLRLFDSDKSDDK